MLHDGCFRRQSLCRGQFHCEVAECIDERVLFSADILAQHEDAKELMKALLSGPQVGLDHQQEGHCKYARSSFNLERVRKAARCRDPAKRLGAGQRGYEELKEPLLPVTVHW